jgi:hypothetical protein
MLCLLASLGFGLLLSTAEADDVPGELAEWIEVELPGPNNDHWIVANNDVDHQWLVSLRDDQPRVRLLDEASEAPAPLPFHIEEGSSRDGLRGRRLSSKVADGWIVSFNAGEFGAGLWWFSPDGKDRYKIAEAWIKGFTPTDAGLLALEWLPLETGSKGRLIRLIQVPGGHWRIEELVRLKHAPEIAVKTADGSLMIATTNQLLQIVPTTKQVEVLLDGAFWGGLYPNSMIVSSSRTIYIGMRHGVAKVEKEGRSYQAHWLLPNQAFVDVKAEEIFRPIAPK